MAALSQQQSVGDQFAAAIYAFVREVIAAGAQPRAYASILAFQQTWNNNKPLLSSSGILWFPLVEDGMWGPNTGKAVKLLTGRTSPQHTADIPAWYKANADLIDTFAAAGKPPVAQAPAVSPPAPWSPSDADLAFIDDIHGAVYLIATDAASGAGGAAQLHADILRFQTIWNAGQSTVKAVASAYKLNFAWVKLVGDGAFGPKTSAALSFATSTKTPTATSGLAAWYMANKALIDSYAGNAEHLAGNSTPSLLASSKATPDPQAIIAAASQVGAQAGSGSLTKTNVPQQQAYASDPGTLIDQNSFASSASAAQQSVIGGNTIGSSVAPMGTTVSSPGTTPPQAISSKMAVASDISKMAPSSTDDVNFSEETVYAQQPKRNLPIMAIGAGLLAMGGVFAYMATRKGSRMRRRAA